MTHIISQDDDELIKKVFLAQRESPTRGDFIKLVEKDLKDFNITYEEAIASSISNVKLKKKTIEKNAAFKQLLDPLYTHKKVKHIRYEELNMQPYRKSEAISTETAKILTAVRSQCLKGIIHNFTKMYKSN